MSVRHRALAGAPERSASEVAQLIHEMVTETLEPAALIESTAVTGELQAIEATLRMLIAGKHLSDEPVVLHADPLQVHISVVYGDRAGSVGENLGKVAGASTAGGWTLHLPTPAPLGDWVAEAVDGLEHITTDAPPTLKVSEAAAVGPGDIDLDALREGTS